MVTDEDIDEELSYSGISIRFSQEGFETRLILKADPGDRIVDRNRFTIGNSRFRFVKGDADLEVVVDTPVRIYSKRLVGGIEITGKVKIDPNTAKWSVDWNKE